MAPDRFAWRQPPYEYEHEKQPIDILAGSPSLREQVDAQVRLADIVASWRDEEGAFRKLREPFLLY
jgi:uncharacterized protein YbbC (DUF1343 family)